MYSQIRIFHIDDHQLFVQGIYSLIEQEGNLTWLGHALNIQTGLERCRQLKPDLVLMDNFLPDGTGIEAAKTLKSILPDTEIILLTAETSSYIMGACEDAGIKGFLPKTVSKAELLKAISEVANHQVHYSRHHTVTHENSPTSLIQQLSLREKQIALLVLEGLTSSDIAERLHLSVYTVNTHRKNMMRKLEIKNTAQLASFAYELKQTKNFSTN